MKRIIILSGVLCFLIIFSISCKNGSSSTDTKSLSTDIVKNPNTANGVSDTSDLPVFKFEEEIHDFGRIYQDEKVSYAFKFKNVGKSDLVITDAHASCGCTIADYPKTPIPANGNGIIDVTFNSEGKTGYQSKNVTIIANTQPNTKVLVIKAQIKKPESGDEDK
jgi:hypothetical protein